MSPSASEGERRFGESHRDDSPVDRDELRLEVQAKYAAVALVPRATYHFHTGRVAAERCRYDMAAVDAMPDVAVESFAGVANPFELRPLNAGERVVDLGSGAGFDSFLAAFAVGLEGGVIGVDMTDAMLDKARTAATAVDVDHVEFRFGFLEEVPVDSGWADVVISNGVFNLCPDKDVAFREAFRVLRPGGVLQFGDIANANEVPADARREIDLWTG